MIFLKMRQITQDTKVANSMAKSNKQTYMFQKLTCPLDQATSIIAKHFSTLCLSHKIKWIILKM